MSPIHPRLLVYCATCEKDLASLCAVQIRCHAVGDPLLNSGTELPSVHPEKSDRYPRCKHTSGCETINGSYTKYTIIYRKGRFVTTKILPLVLIAF